MGLEAQPIGARALSRIRRLPTFLFKVASVPGHLRWHDSRLS